MVYKKGDIVKINLPRGEYPETLRKYVKKNKGLFEIEEYGSSLPYPLNNPAITVKTKEGGSLTFSLDMIKIKKIKQEV